jgi:type II secretory pathway pseudopilin PulG
VELLVVITILCTLMALLLPALHAATTTAKVTQARSDLRQISLALHKYYLDHEVLPPARKYCLTEKRNQYLVTPRELFIGGYLDASLPDVFDRDCAYHYTAVGPGFVNDSPVTIKFLLPQAFPESGGDWVKYSQPDRSPVQCILWSVGPAGTPDFEVLLGFNPLDPAQWYPGNPAGIVGLYFTGKEWRSAP